MKKHFSKTVGLVLGPTLFTLCLLFFHPPGLSPAGTAVLATTLWMVIWWITEAIPISATALLPIVLFPLTGGLDLKTTTAAFGHKYVFLYLGGFMIAIAIEKWGLHKRIALNIIHFIGTNVATIILGFMLATAFMSMWISNTATTVMMLPIGMAIVVQMKDRPETQDDESLLFGKALMLGIAYAASIGGISTLIGTPPNLVFAGVVEELFQIEISFAQWIKFGLPISLVLLTVCWVYLTTIAFKLKGLEFPGGRSEIERLLHGIGKMVREEKTVMIVFALTSFLWITRSYFQNFIPTLDDTIIAMASGILLFVLPASKGQGQIVGWDDMIKIPWGIILLFGGGMALAAGFQGSGLAEWIGTRLTLLQGISIFMIVFILIASVNFLTEMTSNLATTAMLLPVLTPMAIALDVHPYTLMVSATVAASCAFMLPVATPPNAVVFGSGYLRIPDMMKTGIWMNLFSILVLSLFVYFLLPFVWGFDLGNYPF